MQASGLIAPSVSSDGSHSVVVVSRCLVRVEFSFDQRSVDVGATAASAPLFSSSAYSSALPTSISSAPPSHSASFTSEGDECLWRDTSLDASVSYGLMWGPMFDPLAGLSLSTIWPFAPESTWVEGADYTDLNPVHAPHWRLRLKWAEGGEDDGDGGDFDPSRLPYSAALLALREVAERAREVQALADVLGADSAAFASNQHPPHSHAALSSSKRAAAAVSRASSASPPPSSSSSSPSPSSTFSPSSSRSSPTSSSALGAIKAVQSSLAAHIESAQLAALYGEMPSAAYVDGVMKLIMDIDEDESVKKVSSPTGAGHNGWGGARAAFTSSSPSSPSPASAASLDPPRAPCPYGSLLSLLVVQVCRLHGRGQLNVRSVSALWLEFVSECRYHFEAGLDLPHLDPATDLPDYSACIAYQKLQTLQRCIALQRQRREYSRRKGEGGAVDAAYQLQLPHLTAAPMEDTAAALEGEGLADGWQDFDDLQPDRPAMEDHDGRPADGDDADDEDGSAGEEEEAAAAHSADRAPEGALHPLREERLLLSATPLTLTASSERQLSPLLTVHLSVCVCHVCAVCVCCVSVDRPLLVPVSQPCASQTADELEAEAEMFSRLGDGDAAEAMRREKAEARCSRTCRRSKQPIQARASKTSSDGTHRRTGGGGRRKRSATLRPLIHSRSYRPHRTTAAQR